MVAAPSVVVVSGPPGAGKTSLSQGLAAHIDRCALIDGDRFFSALGTSLVPPWEAESHAQNRTVIAAMGAAAQQYARGGYSPLIDAVVGPWFIEDLQSSISHPIIYLILRPGVDVVMKRALGRRSPELTDPAVVASIYSDFSDLGPYERFVLDSSSLTTEETLDIALALIRDENSPHLL